jgi:3-oxoacyl-[acyl-carrier-protein] synthase II
MESKRVVVTGLGAITPIGKTLPEYWEGLVNGRNGAGEITRFDSTLYKTHFACEVKDYNPEDYFEKKNVRKYDHFAQFGLIAADEAIADSGISAENFDLDEVGVMMTSGIGGVNHLYHETMEYAQGDGTPRFGPFLITKMIVNMIGGVISIKYGFRGPNYATVSACASSTHSIIEAFDKIRVGKCIAVVAGGGGAAIGQLGIGGFNAMKALSTRNDDPMTASRPFDLNRDGFVMGEGAGSLVLEEYEHAIARGAKIYAEVVGGGSSADAYHITAPHPEGAGGVLSMQRALNDAGIGPEAIDHINAHGTSTPMGDLAECMAIQKVFGEHAYNISINSTKSMTGHLLGGAGAVEAIATILALKNGIIPPTINHFDDDPQIDSKLDIVFNKARQRDVHYGLSNSFGFGGQNATVIFKKFE